MNLHVEPSQRSAHVVQFYSDEDEFVELVSAYLIEGLQAGEEAIAIATPEHRAALMDSARSFGSITLIDASEVLSSFMVDGRPDADRFDRAIGDVLRGLALDGRRARALGEMVAILWDEGNVTGALELEELWNGLLDELGFSLLCAYPTSILSDDQGTPLAEICALHSDIVGSNVPHALDHATATMQLPFSIESPARARHFTRDMLAHWGFARLEQDASLIVTELGTNAVTHGKGGFIVTLGCQPGWVRLEVEDGNAARPTPIQMLDGAVNGRGLHIVDAIAERWGVKTIGHGKVVWAELRDVRAS